MTLQADLRHVVYALSDALDLVGVDDVAHGKRVGIMAAECGRAMSLPEDEITFLFDLGLLHDIGVSSTDTHRHLVEEFDWGGSQNHAEVGWALLRTYEPLARMALPVRYHHTRWDALVARGVDAGVARAANLTLLADRVDAMAAPYLSGNAVLLHKDEIREAIRTRAGTYFSPDLVEAFLRTSRAEAFWLLSEPRSIQRYLRDMMARGTPYMATLAELRRLAEIFSRIVDAKSPFTAAHSLGVARLARFLGERMGLGAEACDKLEIAGLLHDIGKLRIPDEILDKPAKLDTDERMFMNAHSFETYQILRSIAGFEDIALWAAWHHEEPDGTGYPFHLNDAEMPLEARILRFADIFQAMVQDRPYRQGLGVEAAMLFLSDLAARGRIDARVFATAKQWTDGAMQAARPGAASAAP